MIKKYLAGRNRTAEPLEPLEPRNRGTGPCFATSNSMKEWSRVYFFIISFDSLSNLGTVNRDWTVEPRFAVHGFFPFYSSLYFKTK